MNASAIVALGAPAFVLVLAGLIWYHTHTRRPKKDPLVTGLADFDPNMDPDEFCESASLAERVDFADDIAGADIREWRWWWIRHNWFGFRQVCTKRFGLLTEFLGDPEFWRILGIALVMPVVQPLLIVAATITHLFLGIRNTWFRLPSQTLYGDAAKRIRARIAATHFTAEDGE